MKVLLDECVNVHLREHLVEHDVYTVTFLKWNGIKNGALLQLAADNGFDCVLTTDRAIPAQQNTVTIPVSLLIVLSISNRLEHLTPSVPAILWALSNLSPRSIAVVPRP